LLIIKALPENAIKEKEGYNKLDNEGVVSANNTLPKVNKKITKERNIYVP